VRQYVGGEREVDGDVDADAEAADGHADQRVDLQGQRDPQGEEQQARADERQP
jgi:hypothetical protein